MDPTLWNWPGNAEVYAPSQVAADAASPLRGKHILFLGSSVTEGHAAMGNSFVDYLAAKDGVIAVKEAVSGTTLVTLDEKSYIPRMMTMDRTLRPDAFICQLSTNDATRGLPFGEVSGPGAARETLDVHTIAGAMEFIVSYARETWQCPVMFYTGTRFESAAYQRMVELLHEIREQWQIGVIDLWNDAPLNDISEERRALYIKPDGIHPTRAGYLEWWLPAFEREIAEGLGREQG